MEEHAPHELGHEHEPLGEHRPPPRPRPTAGQLVLATLVAVLFAGATVVAAILSFEWNPAGPVLVVVAAIAGGSYSVRRVHDLALESAAIGLVLGGLVAVLFWPFFDVG
jgi:hypothetical protein